MINVIYLSKQEAYIERRRAGIRYLCSKVKWQTQTLAPTGGAFTQTTGSLNFIGRPFVGGSMRKIYPTFLSVIETTTVYIAIMK
jgi:hypothetical protein